MVVRLALAVSIGRVGRTGGQQEVRALLAQLLVLTQSTAADATALEPVSTVLRQVQHLLGATTVLFYSREAANTPLHERVALDCPPMLRIVLDSPAWADLLNQTLAADH